MYGTYSERRGAAAGLTINDLLDDSYLAAPVPEAPAGKAARPRAATGEPRAAEPQRLHPMLRHLLD